MKKIDPEAFEADREMWEKKAEARRKELREQECNLAWSATHEYIASLGGVELEDEASTGKHATAKKKPKHSREKKDG